MNLMATRSAEEIEDKVAAAAEAAAVGVAPRCGRGSLATAS